jgi:hypothetical protein
MCPGCSHQLGVQGQFPHLYNKAVFKSTQSAFWVSQSVFTLDREGRGAGPGEAGGESAMFSQSVPLGSLHSEVT